MICCAYDSPNQRAGTRRDSGEKCDYERANEALKEDEPDLCGRSSTFYCSLQPKQRVAPDGLAHSSDKKYCSYVNAKKTCRGTYGHSRPKGGEYDRQKDGEWNYEETRFA